MKRHWENLTNWLDHRTGVQTALREFLYEEIPTSSGWHQVFGSVAVFLFLVQRSPARFWRSTMRPRRARLTTACATSSPN
jgi:hypothetical protein